MKLPSFQRRIFLCLLFSGLSYFLFSATVRANVIKNPSFEQAIGEGNWDNTSGRGLTTPTIAGAPDGNRVLRLDESGITGGQLFSFTFQTVSPVQPGDLVTFTAFGREVSIDDADDDGQIRIEFKNAEGVTIGDAVTALGSGVFTRISANSVAPPQTTEVAFVLRIQGSDVGGTSRVEFDDVNAEVNPAKLTLTASKTHVKAGEVVTIFMTYRNAFAVALSNADLLATIPSGFDVLPGTTRVNGAQVTTREGSLIIPLGDINPGQTMNAVFQLFVTHGVSPGKVYDIATVIQSAQRLSERASTRITVEEDPLFDQGTIIGKVFNDANQDGIQDSGEKGVPWVRLVTEEGVVVITDAAGKYHIPAVKAGRHLVKIDGHSLPKGTKFVTEESFLVRTTPGILNKANFAVLLPPSGIPPEFEEKLSVTVTQGLDTTAPKLDVTMQPEVLRAGLGVLSPQPIFRLQMNYPQYVKTWYLEIRDEMGNQVWTGFGVSAPPAEVTWTGEAESGFLIKPGLYSYRLKVKDAADREDWSVLHFFRVLAPHDTNSTRDPVIEIPPLGDFSLFKDGKRSIPLVAKPTLRVQGRTQPGSKVMVNGQAVEVHSENGLFQTEIYTTPGEREILVTSTDPQGQAVTYRDMITVKDSMFFMTALGEGQGGLNWTDGNLQSAGDERKFRQGIYEDGRLSYYLRGKIKGKFLVKSQYDTADKRSKLFTNLDPDDYYPIYGDASERGYEAQDSGQNFYMVVEMERSFVKWGSFQTAFTDTELAGYNRTLSGLKLSYDTLGSTKYGDPNRGFKIFTAKSGHRAAHDELQTTGGSLYYLRNRRVVEGSEKIRVVVRDKIQDMAVESYDLQEGKDYEIDYDEGRIMLTRPLSSVGASDSLISRDILDGSPMYLVIDYEVEADPNAFRAGDRGLRGYTHIGNHLRIGATAVEEKRQNQDYDLRGVDAVLKVGRNSKVSAEYAETINPQVRQALSYNGGLSYAEVPDLRGRRARQSAYLVKGETRPVQSLDLSSYIQTIEPDFSTHNTRFDQGFRKYGMASRYHILNDRLQLKYRFDKNEIHTQLRPLTERGVLASFEKTSAHTVNFGYDDRQWLAEAEYQHQGLDLPLNNLQPSLFSEVPFEDAVAGKLGYYLNEKLLPYAKVQAAFGGKPDHQWGGGIRYEITRNVFAYLEEMFGNLGDSAMLGFEKYHESGYRSYTHLKVRDRGIGHRTLSTTIGDAFSLTEKSHIYSERQYSAYQGQDGYGDLLGYEGRMGDRWDYDLKFERRHLHNDKSRALDNLAVQSVLPNNTHNTVSGGLGYANGEKIRVRTGLEFRRDQDAPELRQWVTRNYLKYQFHQDLSFLGKWDYGKSRFLNPNDTPADFSELNMGLAYRPMDHDRLNLLTRYTWVKDIANDVQFTTDFLGIETDETAHIWAVDLAYDLHRYFGIVEKLALKRGSFVSAVTNDAVITSFLMVHRLNFHMTRKWDLALEYRALWEASDANSFRQGALLEIDREFYDYVRLGLGYNFTDFEDDLRRTNNYDSHGPFVRMTGKF